MAFSSEKNTLRDAIDQRLAKILSKGPPIRLGMPLPLPRPGEPSDHELLRLVEGTLPANEKSELKERLEEHPYSKDRVEILEEALVESGPATEQVGESVRLVPDPAAASAAIPRLVFALKEGAKKGLQYIRGTMEPLVLAPAAAVTRGDANETEPIFEFRQEIGPLEAKVHVEGTAKGVEIRICLLENHKAIDDGRASLLRRGRLVNSVRIREGIADFRGLDADNYVIAFKHQGQQVGQLAVDLLAA